MISERRKAALIEMSKRGMPEEQEIAKHIIEKLDISVNEDEKIIDVMFRFKNYYEKKILIQIWTMVINDSSKDHFTNKRKRNNVIFEITKTQKAEIELYFSIYKRELQEEIDLTVSAFIHANGIFPQSNDDKEYEITQEDRDRLEKLWNRTQTINKTHIRKQISN